jgi:hypothetical protein
MVSKNNDSRLCPKGSEILILLDNSKDTHRGNGPRCSFFLKSLIFAECNLFICIKVLNAMLLFEETLQPDLTIRMRISECLEEGWQAVAMEIDGTDKQSKGIEGSLTGGQRRIKERV